ncbi:MAG: class I SAM-dependent methyltransferase [Gaiella sp.]
MLQRRRAAELAERVGRLLPLTGTEKVLDVGCGTGALAEALAPSAREVTGVDLDERYIAQAAASAPPNCSFVSGDAVALPFPDASFDVAGCLRVLHHSADPERVVAELARVTVPGGRVVVADQIAGDDPGRAALDHAFEQARDATHRTLLRREEIEALLRRHGLTVETCEISNETRDVGEFLDLVALTGEERARVLALAPADPYEVRVAWFVAAQRL